MPLPAPPGPPGYDPIGMLCGPYGTNIGGPCCPGTPPWPRPPIPLPIIKFGLKLPGPRPPIVFGPPPGPRGVCCCCCPSCDDLCCDGACCPPAPFGAPPPCAGVVVVVVVVVVAFPDRGGGGPLLPLCVASFRGVGTGEDMSFLLGAIDSQKVPLPSRRQGTFASFSAYTFGGKREKRSFEIPKNDLIFGFFPRLLKSLSMKPIESDSIQKSSPLLPSSKRPSVRSVSSKERYIYIYKQSFPLSLSARVFLFLSLSNESSLEKEKDERKKGMRSYAFWVLSFRTQ